jgi:methylmalonyl-CoA/ethylmalonyl-CoA epimerase
MMTDPFENDMAPTYLWSHPTFDGDNITPMNSPLLTRIDHVGIAVPDLDEAIAFYGRAFGLSVLHEEVNERQGVREAMLGVGGSGSCIQLLAPLTPESTIAKFLDRSGPGIQQIAYGVDDVEAAAAQLRETGVRMLYDTAQVGTAGSLVNFCHPKDCGGVLVELVQAVPNG